MNKEKESSKGTVDNYAVYTTRLFKVIPKNSALIVRNRFNGKNVKIKDEGFTFLSPFSESKLISLAIRNFDYPKALYEDSNGQDIIFDIAITVKVIKPMEYEFLNTNVEAELKQLLESILRSIIRKYTYEELSKCEFELPEYKEGVVPLYIDDPITIEEEFKNARFRLDKFAQKYGLAVINLYGKSIQQTPEIQEAYNKKIIAEREAQASIVAKEAELTRAKIDAEILKTRAEAEALAEQQKVAARYRAILEAIKDLPPEKQAEIVKVFSLESKGKANVFMSVDGDESAKSGLVAGAAISSAMHGEADIPEDTEEPKKTK